MIYLSLRLLTMSHFGPFEQQKWTDNVSRSEVRCIIISYVAPPISVTHYKTSTKSECANLSTGQQDGRYDDFQTSSDSDDLDDFNDWTAAAMFALAGVTSSSPKSSTYQAVSMKASNSPQYVQPKISSRGRGVSRSSPNTRVRKTCSDSVFPEQLTADNVLTMLLGHQQWPWIFS